MHVHQASISSTATGAINLDSKPGNGQQQSLVKDIVDSMRQAYNKSEEPVLRTGNPRSKGAAASRSQFNADLSQLMSSEAAQQESITKQEAATQ